MAIYDEIREISKKDAAKTKTGDERIYGVAVGIVAEDYSAEMPGRVCVTIPVRDEEANKLRWAKIVPPYAGKKWGMYFIPEKDDQVLLAFENGNIEKPFIIGSVHRDKDNILSASTDKNNQTKTIKTRNGSHVTFFDSKEDESGEKDKISVITANDAHTFRLDNENKKMELFDKAKNCHVEMKTENGEISIKAAKKLTITVGDSITVTMNGDSGSVTVKAKKYALKTEGNIALNADGNVKVSGQQITQDASAAAKIKGDLVQVSGSMVKMG